MKNIQTDDFVQIHHSRGVLMCGHCFGGLHPQHHHLHSAGVTEEVEAAANHSHHLGHHYVWYLLHCSYFAFPCHQYAGLLVSFLINLVLTGSFSFRYCSSTNILCKMFAYSLYMTMGCVLFLQGVLAISRWAAVCKQYWFSVRKSMCASVMGCLVPSFIMILPSLEVWGNLGFDEGTGDNEMGTAINL